MTKIEKVLNKNYHEYFTDYDWLKRRIQEQDDHIAELNQRENLRQEVIESALFIRAKLYSALSV